MIGAAAKADKVTRQPHRSSKKFRWTRVALQTSSFTQHSREWAISESSLRPYHGELVSFSGDHVNVKGYLQIAITFGSAPRAKMIDVQFLVVQCASPYRMILDRPSLNNLGVVVLTPYLAIKFPIPETKIGVIHADQREARICYNECLKLNPAEPQPRISNLDPKGDI
ncbi:hypothetical protein Cni_G10035 [Canna indica]|uniref:Uncharacterized protein n=1 Tax=Canna indica TaxID=4628 RepID=A0AAQ3Q881_9LILI|nr:hypothetical protein Cni_G10035 [Canna indica]